MAYNYSVKGLDPERTAKAVAISAPVSRKQAIEVCNALRGKPLNDAMALLEDVIAMKRAIPFRRFNRDTAHRKGKAAGKYPVKTSSHILDLLKSVSSNAQEKGLTTADLVVSHISAKGASRPWHAGRHARRRTKRTHIEVVVEQRALETKARKTAKKEKGITKAKPKEEPSAESESPKNESKTKSSTTKKATEE